MNCKKIQFEYLGELELIFKTALDYESQVWRMCFDGISGRQKISQHCRFNLLYIFKLNSRVTECRCKVQPGIVSLPRLVWHRHSGIAAYPVQLVTDQSLSASNAIYIQYIYMYLKCRALFFTYCIHLRGNYVFFVIGVNGCKC